MDPWPSVFFQRLLTWTALCSLSALPSFWWARMQFDAGGMALGVVCFILAYAFATSTAAFERFRRRPFMNGTLRVGYGTRIFLSVVFPVGLAVDLFPGLLSVRIVETVLHETRSLGATFAITLLQGAFLNLLLALYMLVIYGLQRAFRSPPLTDGYCSRCGYDLRASPIRCPECGEPTPATWSARLLQNDGIVGEEVRHE